MLRAFVQNRNKILNVGYASPFPLSLGTTVCVFLWSTYASYWSDRCSPQQSLSPLIGDGRRKGGSQERQMRDREKNGREGGMMVSDRVGENEGERKKREKPVGEEGVGAIERNGVGGGGGGEAGREEGRSYEC